MAPELLLHGHWYLLDIVVGVVVVTASVVAACVIINMHMHVTINFDQFGSPFYIIDNLRGAAIAKTATSKGTTSVPSLRRTTRIVYV